MVSLILFSGLLLITLFAVVPFAPILGPISSLGNISVDVASILTLPYLFDKNIQYGPQAIFTYGPWGILYTGVASESYMPLVWLFNVLYTLLTFLVFWYYAKRNPANSSRLLAWFGCVIFPVFWMTEQKDSFFIFPILFVIFTYLTLNDVGSEGLGHKISVCGYVLVILASLLVGWAALAKFNVFILASVANVLVLIVDLRYRRIPLLFFVFAIAVLAGWLTAGQHLENLPLWIVACLNLSSGYSDAMAKGFLKPYDLLVVAAYYLGVLSIIIVGFVAFVQCKNGINRFFSFLFVIFVCAVSVKHAFGGNQMEQSIAVLAITLWFLVMNLQVNRRDLHRTPIAVGVFLVSAISCLVFVASSVNFPIQGVKETFFRVKRNISAIPNLEEQQRDHGWAALLSEARQLVPLGDEFRGKTIDVYPQHTGIAIGRDGMRYDPRPAFLSLNAHTRWLANINAHHLQGNRAPDIVLFQVLPSGQRVNNRYPALADGPSWPLLLSRYNLVGLSGTFLVLRKRIDKLQPQKRLIGERKINLGQQVTLSHAANGLIWAEITIKRTLLGKLIHTVYKSPHVLISVHTANNLDHTYQLVPDLGAAGFLISPLIKNTLSFAELYRKNIPGKNLVQYFKITSPQAPPGFWAKDITLRLYKLSLPSTTMSKLTPEGRRLMSLQLLSDHATHCLFQPQLTSLNRTGQQVLSFHAPCRTGISVSPANHTMTIKFGLQNSAFFGTRTTDGILMEIIALDANNKEYGRWLRIVNPVTNPSDRGSQQIVISWPKSAVARLIIKMQPGSNNDPSYDHSYIQDVIVK